MNKNLQLYEKFFIDNNSERPDLFKKVKEKYDLKSAIYPGCFIHITPSLIFSKTAYIDNDRRIQSFFTDPEVLNWIKTNKEYTSESIIQSFQQSYSEKLPIPIGTYDLMISQYAGFISRECKQYLKPGGILLVNNSHGDAGLAFLNPDYELVGVINHIESSWVIDDSNLDKYFVPKKGIHPPASSILKTMKGIVYQTTADNYIFKKIC